MAGRVEYAAKLTESLPDSSIASQLLADVFVASADSDHGEMVNLDKHKIAYSDDESRALAAVARWHARKGRFRMAFAIAQKCSLARDKLTAYTAIVNEYAKGRGKRLDNSDASSGSGS